MANPFRGDIDVTTDRGFKLWEKATKGLPVDELYDMLQGKIKEFKAGVDEACNRLHWGTIIQAIPIEFDEDGVVMETASLLRDPTRVLVNIVKGNAEQIWRNTDSNHVIDVTEADAGILQQCVQSSMIAAWIKQSLTTAAKRKFALRSSEYCHVNNVDSSYEDDGPTMLRIIFDTADPSTTVGISNLKEKLMASTLSDYEQDVKEMLDKMEMTYQEILLKDGSYGDFMLNIFNSLETSTNSQFLKWLDGKRNEWEDGTLECNSSQLIAAATRKYNNLKSQNKTKKTTKKSNDDKEDDPDSKYIALLTSMAPIIQLH